MLKKVAKRGASKLSSAATSNLDLRQKIVIMKSRYKSEAEDSRKR